MKHRYVILLLLFLPLAIHATECDTIYSHKDSLVIPPRYDGGSDPFAQLRFCEKVAKPSPTYCGSIPARARVLLSFDVDKDGNISHPSILRINRVHYDEFDKERKETDPYWSKNIDKEYCTEEAFRILSLMKFLPAMKNEKPVCFKGAGALIMVYYSAGNYD